jgi:hypothetical protein
MSFFEISLVCLCSHPYCVLGPSDKTLSSSALWSPLVRYTNGCSSSMPGSWIAVDCVWNVMAHTQRPDLVFRRNGRVHLNWRGRQFSRLLAAEVCASAVVMLDTPCSEGAWEYWLPTPFASFLFTSPPVRLRVPSGFNWTLTQSTGWAVSLCIFPQRVTDIIKLRQKKIRQNAGKCGNIIRIYFHSKYTLKYIYTSNSGQKGSRALSQTLNWIKLIKYVWLKSIVSLNSVERNFLSRLSYQEWPAIIFITKDFELRFRLHH